LDASGAVGEEEKVAMDLMVAARRRPDQPGGPPPRPVEIPPPAPGTDRAAPAGCRSVPDVDAVIDITDNAEGERYEIAVDGDLAGFVQYRRRPQLIAFVHTEIDSRFEGRGLGGRLVGTALDAARADGLAVLPFCPFVNAHIQRHPEYADLVPDAFRAQFGV
jgi:predicted GNAT family acetyltransferase